MSKPVGIALIGMGWWGKKMLNVLSAAPEDIHVVRAVEPNLETARAICAEKGVPLSSDYADALADPAVEAVVLATPHALHGEQIERAVAADKHVFCEKPLALTKAGAERAVRLCREAGLVLGMGHERRWEPPIAELLAKADAGEFGRIHQIEANFSHDKFLALDRDNWRLKADQAPAGGMTATGIHLLDLSVRLMGPAESVWCVCEQLFRPTYRRATRSPPMSSSEGAGRPTFRLRSRTPLCPVSRPLARRAGSTSATRRTWKRPTAGSSPRQWVAAPSRRVEVPPAEPVKDNLVAFAKAVRGVEPYPITADHLVNNIALLEAVFASARSGKIETVA